MVAKRTVLALVTAFLVPVLVQAQGAPAESSGASHGPAPHSEAALPATDAALIAEAYHLVAKLGDAVWPGFGQIQAPFLYIAADREYAVGFPQRPKGFETAPGTMIAGRPVQMGPRMHDPDLSASFQVEGVNSVVIGTPEALGWSPTQWALKAAHEMFHVFQHAHGWHDKVASLEIGPRDDAAAWQLTFPFPYEDADVGRLLHLVSYPTFLAIEASSDADALYKTGVAAEALAVLRSVLQAKTGSKKAEHYMLFQEATEGCAKYVEGRIAEVAAGGYEPTALFRALPGFEAYTKVWEERYASQRFLVKHGGRITMNRFEFYHLGLGKCVLLDRLDATWKERYFDEGVWLPDLIERAIKGTEGSAK